MIVLQADPNYIMPAYYYTVREEGRPPGHLT